MLPIFHQDCQWVSKKVQHFLPVEAVVVVTLVEARGDTLNTGLTVPATVGPAGSCTVVTALATLVLPTTVQEVVTGVVIGVVIADTDDGPLITAINYEKLIIL